MKVLLKILFFPINLAMIIIYHFLLFLTDAAEAALFTVSGILLFLAVVIGFAEHEWGLAFFCAAISFVISPFGLPLFAFYVVDKFDEFRCFLSDKISGL